jgi:hypothetical protein
METYSCDVAMEYDSEGYNADGYNMAGFDREGYNPAGFDADGYDREGYDHWGFDREGYDSDGYNSDGYNSDGYNSDGYNADGYDRYGYNADGYDRYGYNSDGYDEDGYDRNGYNEDGYDRNGYDSDGYDSDGYDSDGYDNDDNHRNGGTRADREIIGEYHTSRRILGHIPSDADKETPRVLVGLELELETTNRLNAARYVIDRAGKTPDGYRYALCENDGSLDDGFEIVTGYSGISTHRAMLERLLVSGKIPNAQSHNTTTCGLHVHVCKASMTMYHAAKLIMFIHAPENQDFIRLLARRASNGYAEVCDKKNDKYWLQRAHNRTKQGYSRMDALQSLNEASRYEALNFRNYSTIEFRMFRGTLKASTVLACLEFARICWFFSRDTSANNLTALAFMEYINRPENRADTAALRAYYKEKGAM